MKGYAQIHEVGPASDVGGGMHAAVVVAVPPWPCQASKILQVNWKAYPSALPAKDEVWWIDCDDLSRTSFAPRRVESASEVIEARREPPDAAPLEGFPWRRSAR